MSEYRLEGERASPVFIRLGRRNDAFRGRPDESAHPRMRPTLPFEDDHFFRGHFRRRKRNATDTVSRLAAAGKRHDELDAAERRCRGRLVSTSASE